MAGPWEKYQTREGPWAKYGASTDFRNVQGGSDSVPDFSDVRGGSSTVSRSRPSLFRADSDFRKRAGIGVMPMLGAAAKDMFGFREGAAQTLADAVNSEHGVASLIGGGAKVVQDDLGEPAVRLPSGDVYGLNDAGLDSTDVANVTGNVLTFLTPAGWAAKLGQARNVGLLGRAGLQAGAAGATDAAVQAVANEGQIDPLRTSLVAAGGAGGELVGTGIAAVGSKLGTAARNATTNARAAERFAKENALPKDRALAQGMEEIRAGSNPMAVVGRHKYGFQYTKGQRSGDFAQLSREELLRQQPGAGDVLRQAEKHNARQLESALAGLSQRFGSQAGATPAELVQGAATRLGQQADDLGGRVTDAYTQAGNLRAAVSADAVRALPGRLQKAVVDFAPTKGTTPATMDVLEQMQAQTQGILGNSGGNVAGVTLKALEAQRRILGNKIGAAANKSDRAALVRIKGEFDGWLDDAIDQSLISGDAAALDALKQARGLRAEFGRRFEGGKDADRFIGGLLDGSRTPEELVNIALGASQVSKAGGARFIQRLKLAADNDPAVIGNLRAAHFLRMTHGNNGQPLGMGQIVRNIRTTEYNNASILKALYGKEEWAEIRRLAGSLELLVPKGDFARSSGSAERMARMMFAKVSGGLPLVGDVFKAVQGVKATREAQRVLSEPLRLKPMTQRALPAAGAGMEEAWRRATH